jgi:hypothetical protein
MIFFTTIINPSNLNDISRYPVEKKTKKFGRFLFLFFAPIPKRTFILYRKWLECTNHSLSNLISPSTFDLSTLDVMSALTTLLSQATGKSALRSKLEMRSQRFWVIIVTAWWSEQKQLKSLINDKQNYY